MILHGSQTQIKLYKVQTYPRLQSTQGLVYDVSESFSPTSNISQRTARGDDLGNVPRLSVNLILSEILGV